jgi:hypothetical protein
MDGLEWKRTKYSRRVQRFLRYAERLAVQLFDEHIADSPAIREYLAGEYGISSEYIPYGAEIFDNERQELLTSFGLERGSYCMLMARMEPENNIEPILEGFHRSSTKKTMFVIGNTGNGFGQYLVKRFGDDRRIRFAGAIYDPEKIHALKVYTSLYFHGHSVGGTNPSLLEAMASRALIAAHDNPFNKAVLGTDAVYFSDALQVQKLIDHPPDDAWGQAVIARNLEKIRNQYSWKSVIDQV